MRALAVWLLVASVSGAIAAQDDYWREELGAGHATARRGKLAEAREIFEEIVAAATEEEPEDAPDAATVQQARQALLQLDLWRGEYAEVQAAVTALPAAEQEQRGFAVPLARALERQGQYESALEIWRRLAAADGSDLEALFAIGSIERELGQRAAARKTFEAATRAPVPEDARSLAYLARCLIALGGPDNYERASQLLLRSMKSDPTLPEARTSLGILYFTVYGESAQYPSGEPYLQKVLAENGEVEEALLGLYAIRKGNFQKDPRATEAFLSRALSLNPNSVPALIERGSLFLDDRRFDVAAELLDAALAVNPRDKWALAHRAAAALMMHDDRTADALRERALAVDPGFAGFDGVIGDHLVSLYRFEDAIPFYEKALAADPAEVEALHGLAKARVCTGAGSAAAKLLQRAAELQPGFVSPWRENMLAVQELLETEYRTVASKDFSLWLHQSDCDVLADYFLPALEEARTVLGAKYGYLPPATVTAEVLHTWADFSVRTIGFRGFAALGACFGRFITLVSPSDADVRQQDFMWSATLWHEYTHVITLALSRHRVPRWLTEGFSVYEERQRNRAWERGMDRELFDAYHNGDIVPLVELNRLFRSSRILFGYYQGGLVVEYLAERFGFDKVVELVKGYGDDRSTEDLMQAVFGLPPAEFDQLFLKWVRDEKLKGMKLVPAFGDAAVERLRDRVTRDPNDIDTHVDLGWAYLRRGIAVDAANEVRIAMRADPEHGRALLLHAEMLRQRGAVDEAAEAYRRGFAAGADDFDSRIRFGQLLAAQDDIDGAVEQYQRAKTCWPQCTDRNVAPNLLLAALLRRVGRETEAMMELEAYVQRTGRAFAPRLELAAMEAENGNREEEVELLTEAIEIDPFMREAHVRLGDALEALQRKREALREFRMALAVPTELDRAHLGKPKSEIPDPTTMDERIARAEICVRIAKLHHALGDDARAVEYLERAEREAEDSDPAAEARSLRSEWGR
jgi:tetratricopeptide (TPR) repeat protein